MYEIFDYISPSIWIWISISNCMAFDGWGEVSCNDFLIRMVFVRI